MNRRGPDPNRTNDIELETERLTLDAPHPGDAEQLFALVGGNDRRAICAHLLWDGPDTVKDIEVAHDSFAERTFGEDGFTWVIRDRIGTLAGPGIALGVVTTRPVGPPGRANVGYWLGVPFWRHGVMSEVLRSVIDLGFGELNYQKVEANVFTSNAAGRALVKSVGFRLEGVARSAYLKYGEWVDDAFYGMLHDEWGTAAVSTTS